MRKAGARVEKSHYALCIVSGAEPRGGESTYLERQVNAVTKMDALETGGVKFSTNVETAGVPSNPRTIGSIRQSPDRLVCDGATFDQAYPFEFGQLSQALNR